MPNLGSYGAKADSKFAPLMKAVDVPKPVTYTIAKAEARELKGETKLILAFKEVEAELALNKTNVQSLVEKYGDVEPAALVGKQVTLASVPVQYQGQNTKGIRIVA